MTWQKIRLDTVISRIESGSRPTGGVSNDSGDIPSLGGENIQNAGGISLEGVKFVSKAFYDKMTKGHLADGDVLINKDGAQTGKLGHYSDIRKPACINEHVFLLRGNPDCITQSYLYYILLSEVGQNQIRMQISGSAQPGLKSNFIKGVDICLPKDVNEQSKIAEILSTVDRAIEKTEALIAKQQRIKAGLMRDLLTRGIDEQGNLRSEETHEFKDSPLGRIPFEWDWSSLGSVIEIIDCKHYTPTYVEDGIPIIRPRNIKDSGFDLTDLDYVTEKDYHLLTDKHEPSDGDIVFSRNASFGVPVYVKDAGRFCIGQDVVVMKWKVVDTRFIFYALKSDQNVRQIMNASGGSTFGRIDLGAIRNLKIVFPKDDDEQRKVSKRLSNCDAAIKMAQLELTKHRSLKTALMQDLLTGKRRVTTLLAKPEEANA